MSDYIKRSDAIKGLDYLVWSSSADQSRKNTLTALMRRLPTADVVKVIRCEECKYYAPVNNGDHGYCGTPLGREVYPDDYCSKAERFI